MANARNYEEYRRQVLDELGIEYVTEDITDFRRWRLKVLQGLADLITKADMSEHVAKWLDEHPDITTTIQDGEVTTVKIADEAIDSDKLADGSVTFAKLANGVVKSVTPDYTSGKLKVQFSNGTEVEFEIVDADVRNKIDVKANYYNSIADMKADSSLKNGMTAVTLGYYSKNDGGGATYIIRNNNSDVDNGGNIHVLNNGKVAELLYENAVNLRQFGADGNTTTDETAIVQKAIDYAISMGGGKVIFNAPILIDSTVYIDPGEDGVYLELTGITETSSTGGTGMYYSTNNIIRNNAGDIFSVNRDENGRPFYNHQWSKFSARNLQIYVRNNSNNVIAFHCVKDNHTIFENIFFYGTYESIKYDYSYQNANNETVTTYNDCTKIINCHTIQCKYIAYELSAGDSKTIEDSSCGWCASGIKHAIHMRSCRNAHIRNFMFGNEVQESSTDNPAVVYGESSSVTIDEIYAEFSGMPVILANSSRFVIGSIYLKFDYPSILKVNNGATVFINSLRTVSGTRTGNYDVTGNGGTVKIQDTNVDVVGGAWTEVKIEALSTLMCRMYRRSGTVVAFANVNNNDGYYILFSVNGTDKAQAGVADGVITWGNFKRGTLVGVEIVTQSTNEVKTEVKSLDATDGLKLALLNPDGTNATTIPAGYECLVRFYYKGA